MLTIASVVLSAVLQAATPALADSYFYFLQGRMLEGRGDVADVRQGVQTLIVKQKMFHLVLYLLMIGSRIPRDFRIGDAAVVDQIGRKSQDFFAAGTKPRCAKKIMFERHLI